MTQLEIRAEDDNLTINISQDLMTIKMNSSLHIKNPYNYEYDAAVIYANLQMNLKFQVNPGFNMTGKVSNMSFDVYAFETFFEQ